MMKTVFIKQSMELPAEVQRRVFLFHQHPLLDSMRHVVHTFPKLCAGKYCQFCGEPPNPQQCLWSNEFGDVACAPCVWTRFGGEGTRMQLDDTVYTKHETLGCLMYGCRCG